MRDNSIPALGQGVESGAGPLPCLYSNICTENASETALQPLCGVASSRNEVIQEIPLTEAEKDALRQVKTLSTQHRKSAFVLKGSVEKLAAEHGIQRLGFLTLTFAQHITCPKEAQRRFKSLSVHVLKTRYREHLGVMERQKSGRIHYHLLVVLDRDIRTGFDWLAVTRSDYSSASPALRSEWAYWRKTARAYGFGRTELLPVKTNVEAMAKYVGKYIAKHIEARNPEDKGVRLVRYSQGARVGTTRFQFHSPGSAEWRRKLATFAVIVQTHHPEQRIAGIEDLSRVLGKRWAYHHRQTILAIP